MGRAVRVVAVVAVPVASLESSAAVAAVCTALVSVGIEVVVGVLVVVDTFGFLVEYDGFC